MLQILHELLRFHYFGMAVMSTAVFEVGSTCMDP